MNENELRTRYRNNLLKLIPMIYATGYSLSQYLTEKGVQSICIYCEESDYGFAHQICFDLSMSLDIDVRLWLTNKRFESPTFFPYQFFTANPNFDVAQLDALTSEDNVLILCSERTNENIKRIRGKAKKVFDVLDGWTDMWIRANVMRRLQKIRDKFPFLPVVLLNRPSFPTNTEYYSDMEKYIVDNGMDQYYKMLHELKQPDAKVPKTFEEFGYSASQLVEMLNPPLATLKNNIIRLEKYTSEYLNVANGHRITPGQPQSANRSIYIFGGCCSFGAGCPDAMTSSAHLQDLLKANGRDDFCVENYAVHAVSREKYIFEAIDNVVFEKGDILFLDLSTGSMPGNVVDLPKGCFHIDVRRLFERPHGWGSNIWYDRHHYNQNGQYAIGKTLFNFLQNKKFFDNFGDDCSATPSEMSAGTRFTDEEQTHLREYLQSIAPLRPKIGSIVMNCNPFTLGHRYLIEASAKKVARLFIFVVEEDRSEFSFADRFELVKKGTADLSNVVVVPSGKFIISSLTFTDYFGKSEMQDETIDPSMDIEIFASEIAPAMGINVRFAGEEPLDNITLQYNNAMKKILPLHGIDFEVIERKESGGEVISASRVRKLLEEKNFYEIERMVPETTLEYLKQKYGGE